MPPPLPAECGVCCSDVSLDYAVAPAYGISEYGVEPPSGGSRFVRCCFPGDFVGESSVLGSIDATCTATVTTN